MLASVNIHPKSYTMEKSIMKPKNRVRRIGRIPIFIFMTALLVSTGAISKEEKPIYKTINSNQSLIIENTNLTALQYLDAIVGGSFEERKYSEMYLLGVLDSTEGEVWCGYETYKTITIDEILFVEMKKLSEDEIKKRAAFVIKDILKKQFPCRSTK